MTIPEPTAQPITYAVSCLPEDHIDAPHFTLHVTYRGNGLWTVTDGHRYLARDGKIWSNGHVWRDGTQEPRTEADFADWNRSANAWRAEHRYDLDTALRLAREAAPRYTVNGHTVADVLARRPERNC